MYTGGRGYPALQAEASHTLELNDEPSKWN